MKDFKEWFKEHEKQKYQHNVNNCLNPNNCTLSYIKEMIFDYCSEQGWPNGVRSQLVSNIEERSMDFSVITNTIWEKSYKKMQKNINKTLGYDNSPQLFTTYMRMLNHEMSQEDIQKMLKNNIVQQEWAPLLSNELDRLKENEEIERLVMDSREETVHHKKESGLIRFQNNAVFQYMKSYDKLDDFQATFLYERAKNSIIPDLFESIKTSQENFSLNMDIKNEENKQLEDRCSELENDLERMENKISEWKDTLQEKDDEISGLKDRLEDQIERNQDLKEQLDIVLELTENPIKDIPNNDNINALNGPNIEDDPFGLDEI